MIKTKMMMMMMGKASLTEHLFHTSSSAESFPALPDFCLTSTVTFIVQMKKLRLREVKPFVKVTQLDTVVGDLKPRCFYPVHASAPRGRGLLWLLVPKGLS